MEHVCAETLPPLLKAPAPAWLGWAGTSAVQWGHGNCTARGLKLGTEVISSTQRTDPVLPLNKNTTPSLIPNHSVLTACLAEVTVKGVTADKWGDFTDRIVSIWQIINDATVVLQCNQSYRACLKPINRVPRFIYWFSISYAKTVP